MFKIYKKVFCESFELIKDFLKPLTKKSVLITIIHAIFLIPLPVIILVKTLNFLGRNLNFLIFILLFLFCFALFFLIILFLVNLESSLSEEDD